jgi:hypothetical protein
MIASFCSGVARAKTCVVAQASMPLAALQSMMIPPGLMMPSSVAMERAVAG